MELEVIQEVSAAVSVHQVEEAEEDEENLVSLREIKEEAQKQQEQQRQQQQQHVVMADASSDSGCVSTESERAKGSSPNSEEKR